VLNRQLRRIAPAHALLLIGVSAVATFAGLLLASGVGGDPVPAASERPGPVVATVRATANGIEMTGIPQPTATTAVPARPAPPRARVAAPPAPAGEPASLSRAAGQMIVSGVLGTTADGALLRRIREGRVGGVILMGENIRTVAQVQSLVRELKAAARAGSNPPLMVMTDQEGGTVKRFRTAGPTLSARAMGTSGAPDAVAREQGAQTGRDLVERGVNVDLAPVADVASSAANFLGSRTFADRASVVARSACGFAAGLGASRVGAAFKHFPGLGRASAVNTDSAPVSISATLGALARDWATYRRCGARPGAMVMVSNASYPALTGNVPAVLSPRTYETLRGLGVRGPVITDSLGAGGLRQHTEVAVKAAAAGADLLLYTSSRTPVETHRQLLAAVDSGALSEERVRAAARVITTYKRTIHP